MDFLSYIMGKNAGLAEAGGGGDSYTGNRCYVYDPEKEYETTVSIQGPMCKLSDDVLVADDYESAFIVMEVPPEQAAEMGIPEEFNYLGIGAELSSYKVGIFSAVMFLFVTELTDELVGLGIPSTGVWVFGSDLGTKAIICLIKK